MLVKFESDQIAKHWPIIRYSIEQSLPPLGAEPSDTMKNILFSLLTDRMGCWAMLDEKKFVGIVTTTLYEENCSGTKYLWIYSIFGYETIRDEIWLACYKALSKYAISRNCIRFLTVTDIPRVKELAVFLGGEIENTLISVPFNKE